MKKRLLGVLIASAFPFAAGNAHAAGFALAEQGASGLGNAYAGAAAVAEDASTVWWNPAGMSRLPSGKHLAISGHMIMPSTKFKDNGSSTAGALNFNAPGDPGDAGDTAFVPNLYFAMDWNPAWSFGVGVSVPFGLATEYNANWVGRFQGIKSEVMTININPAVSYKISDKASVGFGINYQTGEIDLLQAVSYSAIVSGALGNNLEGQNSTHLEGDAWGFNIGALFDVTPATRVGIHYRSSLDYKLDGDTTFTNRPAAFAGIPAANAGTSNGSVKLDLETPASASVSVAHKLNDKVELLGDITWTEWSRISRLPLIRTSGAAAGATLDTLVFNFDDTFRYSVGVNYKYSGPWTLKAGFAFDESPVPNATDRSVRLPDNDRTWLSVGATYATSKTSKLDLGYTYIMVKDAEINNTQAGKGTVRGTYEATVHVLSVQYQFSF